jgi:hypothetical protein
MNNPFCAACGKRQPVAGSPRCEWCRPYPVARVCEPVRKP